MPTALCIFYLSQTEPHAVFAAIIRRLYSVISAGVIIDATSVFNTVRAVT